MSYTLVVFPSLIFLKVNRMKDDLKDKINSLRRIVEGQRHLIASLSSPVTDLYDQHNNLDFQVGGLTHWQDEMTRLRVDRGSPIIDLTGEDSEDEVVEIPGFPAEYPHLLEEWEEVPTPGMVGILFHPFVI